MSRFSIAALAYLQTSATFTRAIKSIANPKTSGNQLPRKATQIKLPIIAEKFMRQRSSVFFCIFRNVSAQYSLFGKDIRGRGHGARKTNALLHPADSAMRQ